MNRPFRLATATLTATAALLLTSCGSDEKPSGDDDKIAGAEQGDAKKSTRPSATATANADRPKVELPSDLTMSFEPAGTGDPVKKAVLADNEERMRAVNAAIAGTDPQSEALGYYNTGKALEASVAWVAKFKDAGLSLTGEIRYYNRQVTLKDKKTATLSFCADESKGYTKKKSTEKVNKTPVTKNSYVAYNTQLVKNAAGTWQTSQIFSTRGAAQCQP
ncbi:hypothetical protein JQK87_17655 [Streptomyces sp. G44]|uniref:hypothetical protein n=1 Tax=Streptomyces sp. G44 TaxID=2807632 RepID=UPI00196030FF|nr:hypothetical protein [Streptomyces sp. G44]MBM7170193.1 hypothetical protein [Streptomyces sp. G44]